MSVPEGGPTRDATSAGTSTGRVRWHRVMPLDDLWVGDLVGVEVAGHPVLLINLDDEVRAYENRCPHQATPLSEGELDGELLTCYAHLWEFDARTGQGVNPATACLRQYAVRVEDDGTVSVAVPQG